MRLGRRVTTLGTAGLLLIAGGLSAGGPAAGHERPGSAADGYERLGSAAVAVTAAVATPGPGVRLEAESRVAQRGTTLVADPAASAGYVVAQVSDRDWLRYDDVVVAGSRFALVCFAAAAVPNTEVGIVDVRLGSRRAAPTLSVVLRTVGPPHTRQLGIAVGSIPAGVHRVYLTLRQPPQAPDVSLDYVTFTAFPPPPTFTC